LRKTNILIAVLTAFIFLFSCHPNKKVQQTETKPNADIDSVFFYKQKDIADPLIDAVLDTTDHSSVTLKKELVPVTPPKPDYKLIQGYRVQIFASLDSANAVVAKYKAQQEVEQPVYVIRDGEMFKVQVGDFPYQAQAYTLRDEITRNGFKGAWVVQREIRIPLSNDENNTAGENEKPNTTNSSAEAQNQQGNGKYSIQIAAVSDEMRAQQLVYEVKNKFQTEANYKLVGSVYKVYLGRFSDRDSADSFLQKVRSAGYPDAWLVY